ncbi:DUF6233 domain-containing protein [Streptomyces sp. DH12]|uniref:DUF6233 domain-containing protein n=1 Tax=Streptomyces sp. DH12 TaxID=2857010 RepID=UPI001E3BDCC5|nr:DUF6233 domain-containing protein [Streptomyces sp. DH12]
MSEHEGLTPDLDRLVVLRTWLRLVLRQVEERIAALEAEQAAARRRAAPPPTPDYRIQRSPGAGRAPTSVHVGTCGMGRKAPGVTEDAARRALAEGVPACPVCRPDTELGVLDAG